MHENFLGVKTTISICVNKKLLRMKSTTKQENNQTLKRTVFFIYVSFICKHNKNINHTP